jgi:hypothetical protein
MTRLLPAPLRDAAQRRRLLGWLGVGLAVRFTLMPFAVSSDMLAVYWRSHLIAYEGEVFGAYLVNMGAHYLHALSLRVLDPILPPYQELWTHPWWWGDAEALGPQVMATFTDAPGAFATLFWLKVPYLVADLGAGLLLLAAVAACRPEHIRKAWIFWMLSPIGLYASYLFGRYEAFPVVLVVAALLLVERDRPWLGAVALGLAVTMRTYPLLFLPLFAVAAVRGVPRQAGWAGVALVPLGVVSVLNRLFAGEVGELARLQEFATSETVFAYTVGPVYVFPLMMLLLFGVMAGRSLGWWGRGPVPPGELWLWLLAGHVALFALGRFSPHYLMWLTPFIALALARRPAWPGTLWLHLGQAAIALWIADLWGWGVAVFSPVVPGLPGPAGAAVTPPATAERLDGLLVTAFLAISVLLVWPAVVELWRRTRVGPPPGEPDAAAPSPPDPQTRRAAAATAP